MFTQLYLFTNSQVPGIVEEEVSRMMNVFLKLSNIALQLYIIFLYFICIYFLLFLFLK